MIDYTTFAESSLRSVGMTKEFMTTTETLSDKDRHHMAINFFGAQEAKEQPPKKGGVLQKPLSAGQV